MSRPPSLRIMRRNIKAAESDGRVTISLCGIAMPEAEEILAQVWRRVEQFGTEVPEVRFTFRRDERIDMEFVFSNPTLSALVLGAPFAAAMMRLVRKRSAKRTVPNAPPARPRLSPDSL